MVSSDAPIIDEWGNGILMGIIVSCENTALWEPSQRVGRLFVAEVRALEEAFRFSSGISDIVSDEVNIDRAMLGLFLRQVLARLDASPHKYLFTLSSGCLATMLALLASIQGYWPDVQDSQSRLLSMAKEGEFFPVSN